MREKQSFGNFLLNNAMIIFMIGAAIVVGLLRPTFFSMYNFKNLISNTAVRFIIAVGVSGCLITKGTDLSAGRTVGLAACIAATFMQAADYTSKVYPNLGELPMLVVLLGVIFVSVLVGLLNGLVISLLNVPPFIATLGVMGIARGLAFIITEGQYYDVSSRLPPGWQPLGLPIDWLAPMAMFTMAVVFQVLMTRFQWGRSVFSIGGNETAALFSGIAIGRVKASVYVISGMLASLAGVVLVLVQGQGKADLATGYELDIIASAVVGGASLAGGRGSVMGAVLGTLIFGVLRNALPQIPGATFYDRLIVGLVVIVIVVADQLLLRKK